MEIKITKNFFDAKMKYLKIGVAYMSNKMVSDPPPIDQYNFKAFQIDLCFWTLTISNEKKEI